MAVMIDPFVIEIPSVFLNHPSPEVRQYFQYLNRTITDIIERTGGPATDSVSAQSVRELYPWNVQDDPEGQIPVFPSQTDEDWFYSSKTANHTATDYEFIVASNSITVTLPSQPKLESMVGVRNSDGSTITVSGNGKNINAKTSIRSKLKGTVLILLYIVETDEWVIT